MGRVSLGGEGLVSGVGGWFVSRRSAPDSSEGDEGAAQRLRKRKFSNRDTSTVSGHHVTTVAPSTKSTTTASGGCYITLHDLSPLLVSTGRKLHRLSRMLFRQSRLTSLCLLAANLWLALHFSADGTSVAVIQRDGYVVKLFKIRPIAAVVVEVRIGQRMEGGGY